MRSEEPCAAALLRLYIRLAIIVEVIVIVIVIGYSCSSGVIADRSRKYCLLTLNMLILKLAKERTSTY